MKKLYFISAIMMVLIAAAVSASVNVQYNFMSMETGQPLSGVDTLVYPCIDAGCNYLGGIALPGSGNSGFSSYSIITYPTSLITPFGYANYYFAHGYAPQEYVATWEGTGSTAFTINFNKVSNCRAQIIKADIAEYTPTSSGANIRIGAAVRSAFSDPHNLIGYVLPQYAAEFYSSLIEIRFRIYDSNNVLVYQLARTSNIYMDGEDGAETGTISLVPGTYRAEVETVVPDDQCSNTIPQLFSQVFTIPPFPALDVVLTATPANGVEPLDVIFNCSAAGGAGPYTFSFDSGDSAGPSTTVAGPNMGGYQMFYVYNYIGGIYNATCTVTDSQINIDTDSVLINVTRQPINDVAPIVNLITPPNGTTIIKTLIGDNPLTFSYNVTDDLSDVLNCTIYTNLSGTFEAATSQYTLNNTVDYFIMMMTSVPDGTYIWNVECSDGQLSAFAPKNFTFTLNTTQPPNPEDPIVTLIAPPNGTITDLHDIAFVFNVTDDSASLMDCELYLNGAFSASVTAVNNTQSAFVINNLADGTYLWNVVCADDIGNTGTALYDYILTINSTQPAFQCSDGIDNDGDGLIDFPADPGCMNPFDDNETDLIIPPECSDGIDNDGDGLIDYPADPGCLNATDDDETDNATCIDHLNISRVYMDNARVIEFMTYPLPDADLARGYMDLDNFFTNTGDSVISNASYIVGILNTANSTGGYGYTYYLPNINPYSSVLDGRSFNLTNIANGTYEVLYLVSGVDSYGCHQADSFRFYLIVNNPVNITYECSDGIDNDGDGLIDFPADSGCMNPFDDNETDLIIPPECSDGIDNDGDGLIDFPADPGCVSPQDDDETDSGNQTNQAPIVMLISPPNGTITNMTDMTFIYRAWDDNAPYLQCTLYTNISGTFQAGQSQFIPNGGYFSVFNEHSIPYGNYIWNVECSDGQLSAFAPDNWTFTITQDYVDVPAGVSMSANPTCGIAPLTVSFSATAQGNVPISYQWIFGDGATSASAAPSHTYNNYRTYTATVTITDADGDMASDSRVISVTPQGCGGSQGGENRTITPTPEELLYIGHIGVYSLTTPSLADELAKPGDDLMVSVYLENVADHDLNKLKLSVSILDLGIYRAVGQFDLEKGEYDTKYVRLDIPEDAAKGIYDIRITAQNSEVTRIKYRAVKVV